ncbi:unnamed protein product [Oppiella nova]|uniref:Uncharacterized protein n=1 Tax=Oppiella nova TaxID=334625 RepID=A0A7R9LIJ0_9ACAR|nr:unnamed protein product [Oppiella nova]CAG2163585.1 unnamed protein product [Oppiella nova]
MVFVSSIRSGIFDDPDCSAENVDHAVVAIGYHPDYFIVKNSAELCAPGGLKKFDSNIAKLITIGNSGRRFPDSRGSELKNQNEKLLGDIEKYRNQCMDNMPKQITGILLYTGKSTIRQFCKRDNKQLDNLLKAGACGNSGNNQGVPQCTPIAVDSMLGLVRSITGNTIDVFCGEYTEGSDKCDSLDKPPKKLKSQRRTKSFALPMIDVLRSFPEV